MSLKKVEKLDGNFNFKVVCQNLSVHGCREAKNYDLNVGHVLSSVC